MGLARAKAYTILEKASFKANWEFHKTENLKALYDLVMDHLCNRHPYGEYLAIEVIFGEAEGMRLADSGDVILPPHKRVQSGSKRKESEIEISEQCVGGKRRAVINIGSSDIGSSDEE